MKWYVTLVPQSLRHFLKTIFTSEMIGLAWENF